MSENPQWETLKAAADKFLKAEKYINKPYEGTLETIYPHDLDSGQKVINLDFKGGSSLSLFGASYRNEDGSYPMGLGEFIKSCEALGIKFQGAYVDGELTGVRLVKNDQEINTPKISIRGISNKKIGDDNQTIEKFGWGILEKIENISNNQSQGTTTTTTSAPKRGKLPSTVTKEPEPEIDLKGAWEDALMKLPLPLSEKDCQLQLKTVVSDAKIRKAMSDYRAQNNNLFKTFKDEGFLEQGEDGKYQVAV